MHYLVRSGFKMIPPNNAYYSYSTSYPHRLSQRRPRVCDDRQGAGGDTPPSETRRRGIARSSGPRPSPSPATPKLAPHLWDPLRVPATDAATPLFLPPALSLIHPALYLPASIFVLLTPARNPTSLLTAPPLPLPPADQRSVEATRDLSPEDVRPRATQSASSSSPPSRAGGGEGAEHSALSLPGSCSRSVGYLRTVIPHRLHRLRGERPRRRLLDAEAAREEAAAAVIMTCCCCGMWLYVLCFWVAMHAPGAPAEITSGHLCNK